MKHIIIICVKTINFSKTTKIAPQLYLPVNISLTDMVKRTSVVIQIDNKTLKGQF